MVSRAEFFSRSDEHVKFLRHLEKQYQKAEENIAKEAIDMDFYQSLRNCSSEADTPALNNFALPSKIKDKSSISICKSILKDIKQLNLPQSFFSLEKQVFGFKTACTGAARNRCNEQNDHVQSAAKLEQMKKDFDMAVKKFHVQLIVFCCRWNQISRCTDENVELTVKQTAELNWPLDANHEIQFRTLLDRINLFTRSFEYLNRIAHKKDALQLEFKNVIKDVSQNLPTAVDQDRCIKVRETYKEMKRKCEDLKNKWNGLSEKRRTPSNHYTTAVNFMTVTQLKINYIFGIVGVTIELFGDSALEYQEQEKARVLMTNLESSFVKMKFLSEKLQEECHAALDEIIESDTVFEPSGFESVFF